MLSGLWSGVTLEVVSYQGVVFLPPPERQSMEDDPPLLYGDVFLRLTRPRYVDRIIVRHLTIYSLLIPGRSAERGTLQEDQTEVLINSHLDKGVHSFQWCIYLPRTTLPYERNAYGRVEHRLLASIPSAAFLGRELEASSIVKFVANLAQSEDLRYERRMDGFVEDLGTYLVGIKSPCMTVGGLLQFSLELPCVPADVRLHIATLQIRQSLELSSPTDPGVSAAHVPSQTFYIAKLDHTTPRAHPNGKPIVEPQVLMTSNARPHYDPHQSDPTRLLAIVPAGESFQMTYLARLPGDGELRPTTRIGGVACPIRVSHELRLEVRYWTLGSKERVVRMAQPVSFASCCCLVESMNLPDYKVKGMGQAFPQDGPSLERLIQQCACEKSTTELLALHRKDIVETSALPSATKSEDGRHKAVYVAHGHGEGHV